MKDNLWFEKYRPKQLDDMILPENYMDACESFIKDAEIPHLLLYGPAGSGKTTLASILITNIASNHLSLNASSSDRGIDVIKTTVKQFASSKVTTKGKLNIVFLDEADGLTSDAQNALKNTMEKYHSNCRFILTCNNIDKIFEPIASRCIMYQFENLSTKHIVSFCRRILRKEKIEFNRSIVSDIIERYTPDVRSIVNNLQACSIGGKLTNDYLDRFDPQTFLTFLNKGKIFNLREIWANTRDFTRLYSFLFNQYAESIRDNELRADVMIMIAEYLYKDRTIADREINFTACVIDIMIALEMKIDFKGSGR